MKKGDLFLLYFIFGIECVLVIKVWISIVLRRERNVNIKCIVVDIVVIKWIF